MPFKDEWPKPELNAGGWLSTEFSDLPFRDESPEPELIEGGWLSTEFGDLPFRDECPERYMDVLEAVTKRSTQVTAYTLN